MAEQNQRPEPAAASTTAIGSPVIHAAGGSATVAAIEPSETYRVNQTMTRKSPAAMAVAIGVSTAKTPAATATPFPPWNRSHTG